MTAITALFDARPGREAELESSLRDLVRSVAGESGVLEYTLHRTPDAPGRFFFYERYRDDATVDAHMKTPHLKQVLDRVPELCASAPQVAFFQPLASIDDVPAPGRSMFVILLDHVAPAEELDRHMAAHRGYLAEQYAAGRLLFWGPQVPRTGGVIVACVESRADAEAMMQHDPFILAAVASYRIVEFVAQARPALPVFARSLAT
jgi:quinol monooxygenase YgiN/uncharacterized protein YciI